MPVSMFTTRTMMKTRILLLMIAFAGSAGLISCKKNYVCYCDNSNKPATSYQYTLEHRTKKQASKECAAASNDDPTNPISCTINR